MTNTRGEGDHHNPQDRVPGEGSAGARRNVPGRKRPRDVAVVGVACRFPGASDSRAFWRNLVEGVDSVREIPPDRWDREAFYSAQRDAPERSVSKWGGFLDDVDCFDARFFNVSPREARSMDPQQRLLLEEAWHCIEDSGIPIADLRHGGTAVFVGAMSSDYLETAAAPGRITDSYTTLGTLHGLLANRVSYALGLEGPSLAVDAAHASSLVALHEARGCLLLGEARYALAAGVNLNLQPRKYVSFSKAGMLSPEGRCKTFDESADGYVPGEGVAVLLLQPLADAVAEGNRIYGVIAGSAVHHGGHARSLTVPQVEAQRHVILSAYEDAGFGPESVTYVETHGTGTPLGDAVEVQALKEAFRRHTDNAPPEGGQRTETPEGGQRTETPEGGKRNNRSFCCLGAVKTNVGHLEACSGLAGVIKVLLMMRHRHIPPNLHFRSLNPSIDLTDSPFRLALEPAPWEPAEDVQELRAGVSSFGIGGTNAHVLLTSWPGEVPPSEEPYGEVSPSERPAEAEAGTSHPFVLSARTPESLAALVERWTLFAGEEQVMALQLRDVCATLALGRVSLPCRTGAVVGSWEDVRAFLAGWEWQEEAIPAADGSESTLLRWLRGDEVTPEGGKRDVTPEGGKRDTAWRADYPDGSWKKVALPLYPFERRRFWLKTAPVSTETASAAEAPPDAGEEAAAARGTLRRQAVRWLRGSLAELLDCPPEDLDETGSLVDEHGVDSFVNQEWLAILEKIFGKLPQTLLFEFSTLGDLAGYFVEHQRQRLERLVGHGGGEPIEEPGRQVASTGAPEAEAGSGGDPVPGDHAIAVVGLAGRFPGARDIRQFWANLKQGRISTGEVPPERWDWREFYDEGGQRADKAYTRWGGFLEDCDRFDPLFFKISPWQAEQMDPQQRLFLENAWACIEDAGYRPEDLPRRTGVFAGSTTDTYALAALEESLRGNFQCPDTDAYDVANRVSFFFDFHGPSMAVDTACSSSLTAVTWPCRACAGGSARWPWRGA